MENWDKFSWTEGVFLKTKFIFKSNRVSENFLGSRKFKFGVAGFNVFVLVKVMKYTLKSIN